MKNNSFKANAILVFVLGLFQPLWAQVSTSSEKPNVLLIMVDDMNDWVGAFGGHPQAITPNMDALAEKGVVFRNAYCSAPLCNPSRTSLLTGYNPSTTGVYGNEEIFREVKGFENTVTLPQYFGSNGYKTAAAGKLFHSPRGADKDPRPGSDPGSFQEEHHGGLGSPFPEEQERFQHGLNLNQKGVAVHLKKTFDWVGVDLEDEMTNDWQSADYVANLLNEDFDQPFFFACGIFRPHLPWYAPKKYFDLYNEEEMMLPTVLENDLDDVGKIGERIPQKAIHSELLRTDKWKSAVKGYLANLSYADACVGHLLKSLEESNHASNTIVVLMGDHGWNLGEKQHWSKNVLWEESAKTPLIIYDPRRKEGSVSEKVVSLIDVYPTLIDMCGLPVKDDLEGQSLRPLLDDPDQEWETPALTTKDESFHSLRTDRYRYIVYPDGFEELYDHENDPLEWVNIALNSENEKILQTFRVELKKRLKS